MFRVLRITEPGQPDLSPCEAWTSRITKVGGRDQWSDASNGGSTEAFGAMSRPGTQEIWVGRLPTEWNTSLADLTEFLTC
jgi:hypothetical protein